MTVLREQTEERPLRRCEGEDESGKTERARVRRDIMASAEVAVVKQLDFTAEEGGPAEMVPVQLASAILASELAEAKENPSYESFQQAYAKIVELTDGRFERIRQCAANAAANGRWEPRVCCSRLGNQQPPGSPAECGAVARSDAGGASDSGRGVGELNVSRGAK